MSNFDEIESLLSLLLVASMPVLSDSERAEVQRFINVDEYGLALETAVDIYCEEKKVASDETVHLVERLAVMMSMNPGPLRDKLLNL